MRRSFAVLAGLVILSACGSSAAHPSAAPTTSTSAAPTSTTTTTTAPPTTTTAPPVPPGYTVKFKSPQGDAGMLEARFGEPVALAISGVDQAAAASCRASDRSMVVRVDTTLTVTSSLPTDITAMFSRSGSDLQTALLLGSTSPSCDEAAGGNVGWTHVAPGVPISFTLWVIYRNAITPNTPQGDRVGMSHSFFHPPQFLFGSTPADVTAVYGPRIVTCGSNGDGPPTIVYAGDLPTRPHAPGEYVSDPTEACVAHPTP